MICRTVEQAQELPNAICSSGRIPGGQSKSSEQRAVNGQALAEQTQQQKAGPHREDALPGYRIALEESRNAFAELMAQPEKIRRNVGAMLGFAGVAVSIFSFARGRPDSLFGPTRPNPGREPERRDDPRPRPHK